MAGEAWAEGWREPDGHWRWRYVELDAHGSPRLELPSAEHYPNRRAAAEAARTAYPGIQVRRRYPRGSEGGRDSGPDDGWDGDFDGDLDDGHHRGRRRARHRQGRGSARRQRAGRRGRGAGRPRGAGRARGGAGGFARRVGDLFRFAALVLAGALLSKLLSALLSRLSRPRRRPGTRDPCSG
jgi:hypothetical protein